MSATKAKNRGLKIFVVFFFIIIFLPVMGSATKLDFNSDCSTDLEDALIALKVISNNTNTDNTDEVQLSDTLSDTLNDNKDIDGDGKIGLQEVIYVLKILSGDYELSPYDNDTREQAELVSVSTPYEGSFYCTNDEDWFKLVVEEGCKYYEIDAENIGEESKAKIDLYEAGSETLLEPVTADSQVTNQWIFQPGTYYAKISNELDAFGKNTAYKLIFSDNTPDDGNDIPEQTEAVTVGTAYEGDFYCPNDEDWFKLVVDEGCRYYEIKAENIGEKSKTKIELYDSETPPEPIVADSQVANQWIFQPGTYYAKVSNADSEAFGENTAYKLTFSDNTPDDGNDIPEQTEAVTVATAYEGDFYCPNDEDWFKLTAEEGCRHYKVETEKENKVTVELYGTDGKTILKSVTGDGQNAAQLEWISNQSESYYVRISNADTETFGESTEYKLIFSDNIPDDNNDTHELAKTVTTGTQYESDFYCPNDEDWFKLEAEEGCRHYKVETEKENKVTVELYGTDGKTVLKSVTGDDQNAAQLEWISNQSESYYIRISSADTEAFGENTAYKLIFSDKTPYDNDDTHELAKSVTIGTQYESDLYCPDDKDWFKLEAEEGCRHYKVETEKGNKATVELYDTDGKTVLKSVADDGQNAAQLEWVSNQSGSYYVRISSADAEAFGENTAYKLIFSDNTPHDNDDTYEQAKEVTIGSQHEGDFYCPDDEDWFEFDAEKCGYYKIETEKKSKAAIELYDTDGKTVLKSATGDGQNATQLEWIANRSGTYYVRISNTDAEAFGENTAYKLIFSDNAPDDNDNTHELAKSVTIGTQYEGNFYCPNDEDWIEFDAEKSRYYVIEAKDGDVLIELYDSDGSTLLNNSDNSQNTARLEWSFEKAGTYYAKISNASSDTFGESTRYRFELSSEQADYEDNNTPELAKQISVADDLCPQYHNFYDSDNEDWIKFVAEKGTSYEIEAINIGSEADVIIGLYDSDGKTMLSEIGGKGENTVQLECNFEKQGTYYVKIKNASEVSGENTEYLVRLSDFTYLYENNDTFRQAKLIIANDEDSQRHNFHDADDEDWIMFYGEPEKPYFIEAKELNINAEPKIEIYNTDGRTLLKDENESSDSSVTMNWTCPREGIYFVKITNAANMYGENTAYSLSLRCDIPLSFENYEDNDTAEEAKWIKVGADQCPQYHNFDKPGDEDWIKFYAKADKICQVEVKNIGDNSDVIVEFYNTDATEILDDGGGWQQDTVFVRNTIEQDGIYYVRIANKFSDVYENTEYIIVSVISDGRPALGGIIGLVRDTLYCYEDTMYVPSSSYDKGIIPNVSVIYNNSQSIYYNSNSGMYYFPWLRPGTYELVFKTSGYKDRIVKIDVINSFIRQDLCMVPE
ncbi:MAG: T9SS type A sorting domain-containing protein [Desulfobacterales bacterium]|nr:T9SS type A sorting domain-containing protein [Desulfobacterales bacterium]